jgi:hypothetical protein
MTIPIALNYKHICNVAFIFAASKVVISKDFISIVVMSVGKNKMMPQYEIHIWYHHQLIFSSLNLALLTIQV